MTFAWIGCLDLFGEIEETFCVFMADPPGDPSGQAGKQGHDPAPGKAAGTAVFQITADDKPVRKCPEQGEPFRPYGFIFGDGPILSQAPPVNLDAHMEIRMSLQQVSHE